MAERLAFLHRMWRLVPQRLRRAALQTASRIAAPRPNRPPPATSLGVQIVGEMGRISGLGEAARLLHSGVAALHADAGAIELAIGHRPAPAHPVAGAALILHVNAPSLPLLLARAPHDFLRGRRVIGFWNWEIETVPAAWRKNTDFVHEVWAPTGFTATALDAIMPGRVRVVPYPLAATLVPAMADRAALGLPDGTVVVTVIANLGASFARKNPLGAIASFRAAFGDRPDRLLLLKLAGASLFPRDLAQIRDAIGASPNIRLIDATWTGAEMRTLLASSDILLSLHRAEGFGLVPAEAMLRGIPVIATGWSGSMQFMNERSAALVPYRLVPVIEQRGDYAVPGARWAEPDHDAAVHWLRRLADDPVERASLAARGKAYASSSLTLDPLATALQSCGIARLD